MADNVLRFEFLAADHFSPVAEKVNRKLEGVGERLGKVGKLAAVALGGVAVTAVAAFGYEMVKGVQAAASYETLLNKTSAVIKSTGNVAHLSVDGIKSLAESLSHTSGVEDELIINSENVLATFTNIRNSTGKNNDIYNQATGRILDLSVAMGEDLQSATVQVGKALNDPIKGMTALQRVGVTFNATQKEQIKHLVNTGHLMGAQKIILGELGKEFGGAAKAAGSGFGGAMSRVKNALNDTFRDLALGLMPALTKAANWFADKLPGAIKATAGAFGVLGGWLGKLRPLWDGIVLGVEVFWQALTTNTGIDEFEGVLGSISNLGVYIKTALGVGRTVVIQFGAALLNLAKVVGPFILRFYTTYYGLLFKLASIVGPRVIAFFKASVPVIVSVARVVGGYLVTGISILVHYFRDMLMPALSDAARTIFPALKDAVSSIGSAFADHMDVIKAFGQALLFILKALGVALAIVAVLIVKVVIPVIAKLLVIVLSLVGPIIRLLLSISGALITVVTGIYSMTTKVGQAIGAIIAAIVMPWVNAAKLLYTAGQATITGAVNGIKSAYSWVTKAISATIDAITGAFKSAGSWLVNVGKSIIDGLVSGFQAVWPHILIAIGHTIDIVLGPWHSSINWLVMAGQAILRGLMIGFTAVWGFVSGTVASFIHDKIIGPFVGALSWLYRHGRDIVVGLWTGFTSFVSTVARGIAGFISTQIVGRFVNAVSWLYGRGRDIIVGLWHGISGFFSTVYNGIYSFIHDKIIKPFFNAGGWLLNTGKNIIRGLWAGITSIVKDAYNWVKAHIADPIIGAVEHFFGINSPSTVMAGIGRHMITGLIVGLTHKNPVGLVTKIFGNMPRALEAVVNKGFIGIEKLSSKAWGALRGIGSTVGSALGFGPQTPAVSGGNLANERLGQSLAASYGWTGQEWLALRSLWIGESGWNNFARNPSSGAFGIPQALPASKMGPNAVAGDPYAQIIWGLRYIRDVYGSPMRAWETWNARNPHWYDKGGMLNGIGIFGKNTNAPERVLSPRQTQWFERAMAQGIRGGGGGNRVGVEMHWHFDNYVGDSDDLVRSLTRAARRGQLDPILRLAVKA